MDLESLSDEELVKLFVEGDTDAFTPLVRRHEDRIFALAHKITRNRSDAFDVVQETFMSVLRQASSFKGEASFGTWVYRIAVNASNDVLRRAMRVPVPQEHLPERASAPRELEDAVALRLDVSGALVALPDEYRGAVALHDLAGVPYEEIARITRVPVGTVKSRISRGRRLLAGLVEQPVEAKTSKDE